MNKQEVKDHLESTYSCDICTEILYEPVTLLCQHTYCRACLRELVRPKPHQLPPEKRCPTCQRRFFLPESESVNFKVRDALDTLLKLVYDEEEITKMNETRKKDEVRLEIREEVAKELRAEMQDSVLDNLVFNNQGGDQQNLENTQSIGLEGAIGPFHPYQYTQPSLSTRFWRFMRSPESITLLAFGTYSIVVPVYLYRTLFKAR